jgi:two-component system, OmpR family, sensor kinase
MSFAIHASLTPSSIRAQLTLWYLLMLAGALAAFAAFVFVVRARTLYEEADADLTIQAQRVLAGIQPALLELDVASALAGDERMAEQPFAVRERSGFVTYRSPAFPGLGAVAEAAAVDAARGGEPWTNVDDRFGNGQRILTLVAERTGAPSLVLQVAAPTARVRQILGQLATAMLVWFGLVLGAASYGGSFIARRALRPVDTIVGRVRAIQASQPGARLDLSTGSDELDRLAATLNDMLDRLEESMHGAQRFAADASHELQTPIAAMRAAVDLCLTDERRGADNHLMASDLLTEIDRLSTLVRDLRLLAIADAGHLLDRIEAVDLTLLVGECCDIVRAVAEPYDVAVSVDILSHVTVNGSALHLRRALLNLALNAVRYTAPNSAVQITVGHIDHEAVVAIVDEGCGIGADDLPHIFERFYRADPARARDTGGTGLGLPIADQIIRSHGGRIEVSSVVDRGSTFAVFLPLSAVHNPVVRLTSPQTMNAF